MSMVGVWCVVDDEEEEEGAQEMAEKTRTTNSHNACLYHHPPRRPSIPFLSLGSSHYLGLRSLSRFRRLLLTRKQIPTKAGHAP